MNHIIGEDHNQMQFLSLKHMVPADFWARVIDLLVDLFPLQELGFKHAALIIRQYC
ncbi:MAG: hypothetical protein QM631_17410 [Dysgonomonas sp.]